MPPEFDPELSNEQCEQVAEILQLLIKHPQLADKHPELTALIAKSYKQARKRSREATRKDDRQLREQSGRCQQEHISTETAPIRPIHLQSDETRPPLKNPQRCYTCKQHYHQLDSYYHLLCPTCAATHRHHRNARADLSQRTALITGGRIKIGFELGLKLLRDGARVLVTTRFPHDAASRYLAQDDAHQWADRLQIHALDLRHLGEVQSFIQNIADTESLSLLFNNAAQTVARPSAYYRTLMAAEQQASLTASAQKLIATKFPASPSPSKQSAEIVEHPLFPQGLLAPDGQPLDLRETNSWTMELEDIPTLEFLETHLINTFSPFLLVQGFLSCMQKSTFPRFVVNVSAMEGQFTRENKTSRHAHTNMAKAGMNMLTRTSAADLAQKSIYMNSVDTGWITEENPFPKRKQSRENGFVPPLDEIDGAARIYAPVIEGLNTPTPPYGKFFKDYEEFAW